MLLSKCRPESELTEQLTEQNVLLCVTNKYFQYKVKYDFLHLI